jgi:hypothetical protein
LTFFVATPYFNTLIVMYNQHSRDPGSIFNCHGANSFPSCLNGASPELRCIRRCRIDLPPIAASGEWGGFSFFGQQG